MTGIVVVTWNSAGVIGHCLDACLAFPEVGIVVVDNASSDETVQVVRSRPGVKLIANAENLGFAAGVNQGVAALDCAAVLLLNPDAAPVEGIAALAKAASAPGIGAAGGQLVDEAGRPQDGFNVRNFPTGMTLAFEVLGLNRLVPSNLVNRRYRRQVREAGEVDQPAGAFLMINRNAWQAVGGFDESFWPAWFEDVDYCMRLRQAGFRILYVPEASAHHIGGHSASRLTWGSRQLFWYGSLLRYAGKHLPRGSRRLVAGAVMAASIPRSVMGFFGEGRLSSFSVYIKIFRLAFGYWCKSRPISHLAVRSS